MKDNLKYKFKNDISKLVAEYVYTVLLIIFTFIINVCKDRIATMLNFKIEFGITGNRIVILFVFITIVVTIIEIKTRKKYKYFPRKIKYKYTNKVVNMKMIYNSRTDIEYCIESKFRVEDKNLSEISASYDWTGESIKDIYLDKDSPKKYYLEFSDTDPIHLKTDRIKDRTLKRSAIRLNGKYIIKFRRPIPNKEIRSFNLSFLLTDKKDRNIQFLGYRIRRPTENLVLEVSFNKSITLKKIWCKRKLIFGDKVEETINAQFMTEELEGNGSNMKKKYTLKIHNPEIFYNYYIEWEFE
ncbi:hypothetical protein [Thomasclavelia cocleata]|uniref:hypothetical protein n=1 Tax=Thomasclavelia cocleata TaxID=69824 RepID=UPI0024321D1B|nr:hypothetical protein [Thomasclavelia cocleata]